MFGASVTLVPFNGSGEYPHAVELRFCAAAQEQEPSEQRTTTVTSAATHHHHPIPNAMGRREQQKLPMPRLFEVVPALSVNPCTVHHKHDN